MEVVGTGDEPGAQGPINTLRWSNMNPASEDASRRAGTCSTHFALLHYSPYDDPTELAVAGTPLVREYRAIGVIDDEEIGQPSDIVSVTFAG